MINIDVNKQDVFAEKLLNTLNNGALALMISIGHRTGLFDTMNTLPYSSSLEVADAAGLNERYIREWLGAMTVSKVIECDPVTKKYLLPSEHAAVLTREAGADNMAVFTQYMSVLGSVEDKVVDCFKKGGGVPYSEFKRFHEVMAEDSGQSVVSSLFDHILPLVPGLTGKLENGIKVLDLGCGRGRALNMMAEMFPNSKFYGYDLSGEAINYARDCADKAGLSNVSFEVKDLTEFDIKEEFDFVTTFDAVHDQARPDNLLKGIYNVLKDDGVYLMQDIAGSLYHHNNIDHPLGTLLYTVSCMHCMTVSLAQDGMGLGAMWGKEQATEMLRQTGFTSIEIKELEHDIQNYYYIIRK
jgi:2-polyprenyl-3-methyl-5-hydroxy-6-metoxy-1,4-benzoquinol methylase